MNNIVIIILAFLFASGLGISIYYAAYNNKSLTNTEKYIDYSAIAFSGILFILILVFAYIYNIITPMGGP